MDMAYNQFTIAYIEAVRDCLHIEIDSLGNIIYLPDVVSDSDLIDLKQRLSLIWKDAETSIEVVKGKVDANLQSCQFGIVNDFDLALKVGFLISDRVVLLDYLFQRILVKKSPSKINRTHLGVIANGLVSCLNLAKNGRIVIIPHPLYWNPDTLSLLDEAAEVSSLNPDMMSMLSTLSIAKYCKVQPYTIAESTEQQTAIVDGQLDLTTIAGRDTGDSSLKSILAALMSERLLSETKFNAVTNISLDNYSEIIRSNKSFYLKYMNRLNEGGSIHSDMIFKELSGNLIREIITDDQSENHKFNKVFNDSTGILGAGLSIAGLVASTFSTTFKAVGAVLGLASKVSGLVKPKESEEKIIVSVFRKLYHEL